MNYTGHPGDTLASALLANGRAPRRRLPLRRAGRAASCPPASRNPTPWSRSRPVPGPRGRVHAPRHHRRRWCDGLEAPSLLSGLGKLDPAEDRAEYDKKYVHTDVLVVGGGPAGLAAAREAVRAGARVILVDDQPELGGSLLSGPRSGCETIEGQPALDWVADVEAELVSARRVHAS